MITWRNANTIERRLRIKADLDGHARAFGLIGPTAPRTEYVTFALGSVPRNERVTLEDVREALAWHLTRIDAELAHTAEVTS